MPFKKEIKRLLYKYYRGSQSIPVQTLGADDVWTLSLNGLNDSSNILCAGVGRSMTFELELASRLGCEIRLLDPSPTGIDTFNGLREKAQGMQFLPVGLGGDDEVRGFGKPMREKEGSFQMGSSESDFQLPCRSLSSLMREWGWDHIDFLKMDIEGFEYEVLHDILSNHLVVNQICVEFHTKKVFNVKQTQFDLYRWIFRMRKSGYYLTHVNGRDHSFIRL